MESSVMISGVVAWIKTVYQRFDRDRGRLAAGEMLPVPWYKWKPAVKKILLYFLMVDAAFIFLLPILYMLIISNFSAEDLLDPSIRWIPAHFYRQNYRTAFTMMKYQSSVSLTLLLTTVAIIGQTIFGSLAGYALARLNFPGKKWIFGAVLLVWVIPAQAMMLPNLVFFTRIQLHETLWPMILPELLGNGLYGALFVIVFRQVFLGIPKDLEDAAAIDGAGIPGTFTRIVAPLASTAYVTVGLFSFVWHWNEYIRPSYFLTDDNPTLTFALSNLFRYNAYTGKPNANEAVQGAGVILVMAPVIFSYFFVQRYFVQGVQLTGIKG
jgi:multiple sugar transport system permease protein